MRPTRAVIILCAGVSVWSAHAFRVSLSHTQPTPAGSEGAPALSWFQYELPHARALLEIDVSSCMYVVPGSMRIRACNSRGAEVSSLSSSLPCGGFKCAAARQRAIFFRRPNVKRCASDGALSCGAVGTIEAVSLWSPDDLLRTVCCLVLVLRCVGPPDAAPPEKFLNGNKNTQWVHVG